MPNKTEYSCLSLFERNAPKGTYLAFADGLRFIAVSLVVLAHLGGYFEQAYSSAYSNPALVILKPIFKNGHRGVDLFFVLSAFIIGYYALRHKETHQKNQPLAHFYHRRFYRIYPPFVIVMVLIFIGNVWLIPQYTFTELAPSLFSTLTYTYKILSHFKQLPELCNVTWTLEIEIQFYLLFPLLGLLYSRPPLQRRLIMFFGSLLFEFVHQTALIPFVTVFDYMPLFLAGLLFADLYHSKSRIFALNPSFGFSVILLLFLAIILPDTNVMESTFLRYAYPYIILFFFGLSSQNSILLRLLENSWVCIFGGMCYSIYLLHTTIISLFHKLIGEQTYFNNPPIDSVCWLGSNLILIILTSSIFYYFVEKPFMSKQRL